MPSNKRWCIETGKQSRYEPPVRRLFTTRKMAQRYYQLLLKKLRHSMNYGGRNFTISHPMKVK